MASRTTLGHVNGDQIVRLPEAVAFPRDVCEVEVVAVGSSRIITPVGQRWNDDGAQRPGDGADVHMPPGNDLPQEREPF